MSVMQRKLYFCSEDGSRRLFRHDGKFVPDYTTSCPR